MVLVLHGGSEQSALPVPWWSLAVLRLRPVARAVARRNPTAEVYRLRFAGQGWNGSGDAPIRDARWALGELAAEHGPLPTVLVGHSMGARTALRLAEQQPVAGVVALAPWITWDDPVAGLAGVRLVVVQGDDDQTTPEPPTRPWFDAAAEAGAVVSRTVIGGAGHAMVRQWRRWHRLAAEGVAGVLDAG